MKQATTFALVLILISLATFSKVPSLGYVNYDDYDYVVDNVHIRSGLTRDNISRSFTTADHAMWSPLTWISYMVDIDVFGNNPRSFHLTSLLLHLCNTLLLFWFLRASTGSLANSGFVAALFAVHPLHVESVAWIAERKGVLSTTFWFFALIGYVRYCKKPGGLRYGLSLASFSLGLLTKPMIVTLPFLLLLLDYWPLQRLTSQNSLKKLFLEKIPFVILAALSSLITYTAQLNAGALSSLNDYPLWTRIANGSVSYLNYISRTLIPLNLAFFYPFSEHYPPWQVVGSFLALTGVSAWIFLMRKLRPYCFVGWFWYLGTLVPVLGLVKFSGHAMADRFTYVPLIGLFMVVSWSFSEESRKFHVRKLTLAVLATLVIMCFIFISRNQVTVWHDSISLFRHASEVTKDNWLAENNLGREYFSLGSLEEALMHYRQATKIRPWDASILYNLGVVLERRGQLTEAAEQFLAAIKYNPDNPEAYNNLGATYFKMRNANQATDFFLHAVRLNPNHADAHYNLGVIYEQQGKFAEAALHFRHALENSPNSKDAKDGFARMLVRLGPTGPSPSFRSWDRRLDPADGK